MLDRAEEIVSVGKVATCDIAIGKQVRCSNSITGDFVPCVRLHEGGSYNIVCHLRKRLFVARAVEIGVVGNTRCIGGKAVALLSSHHIATPYAVIVALVEYLAIARQEYGIESIEISRLYLHICNIAEVRRMVGIAQRQAQPLGIVARSNHQVEISIHCPVERSEIASVGAVQHHMVHSSLHLIDAIARYRCYLTCKVVTILRHNPYRNDICHALYPHTQ